MEKHGNRDWTPELVLIHLRELISANDLRYGELFAASEKAITTAFTASEKAATAAFVAAEKAVALSEANAERWREDAKLWRATITERERDLTTKTEFSVLKERLDRSEGSGMGKKDLWGWIIGAVMTTIAIGSFFFK